MQAGEPSRRADRQPCLGRTDLLTMSAPRLRRTDLETICQLRRPGLLQSQDPPCLQQQLLLLLLLLQQQRLPGLRRRSLSRFLVVVR